VSNLTNLTANTTYYLRAYATNSVGTAYGNTENFTTVADASPCPGIPTITYGGKVYNTVQIGSQCWMKENLNIGIRINGSQDQTNNPDIEKYCYNDLESNCDVYGGLYQWGELMQYDTIQGVQGICPPNWHVPTDNDWTIMTTSLGGRDIAGGKLKETGIIHWQSPNYAATNESGFAALPGGEHFEGGAFQMIGSGGYWWSSTKHPVVGIWCRSLYNGAAGVGIGNATMGTGFSIRCIKD